MSYVDSNLVSGESVTYRASRHWIVLFWPTLFGLFLGVPGLFMTLMAIFAGVKDAGPMLGVGIGQLLLGALLIGFGLLRMKAAEFAITNKRIILKYGIVAQRTGEMFLQKVESIGVDQNVLGRMFDYGTITVRGTGGTLEPFSKVAHALEFRRQVQEQISRLPGMQTATAIS